MLFTRLVLNTYRVVVMPLIHLLAGAGYGCRFEPSCSHYAEQAIAKHGALRGVGLAMKRVLRCHPWGGQGFDPVPEIEGA
jgi:putative membrane protein insertion efficiency factor